MDLAAPTVAVTPSLPLFLPLFVLLSVLRVHPEEGREQLPPSPVAAAADSFFHRRIAPVRFLSWTALDGGAAAVAVTMVFIKGLCLTRKNLNDKTT